ncbi:protein kinase [Pendulispora rubella]|uniref:Protein kinase n=1 Tax=Pendulispora rubella TaxID=2741070 RepID=A0ABZ2LHM1_9BACT
MNLCGRYRITRLLGIGGMAAVYAGIHRNGHAVAIKVLHERLSTDPELERLFRREAHLANKIQHPGIVPVIDDDVAEDGCIFLVMPLLTGETLRARAERTGSKLPAEEVALVAHQVLNILSAAHDAKIVHRDIKPENLYVTQTGDLRVLDFGIARFFETNEMASVTRSGRAVGTPAFMAPEQALGRIREIDGRTDLWSLGATMFKLLSGKYVHQAESGSELLIWAATKKAPRLQDIDSSIPGAICDVIDRALEFDRADRWPDAEGMNQALAQACASVFQMDPSKLARMVPELPPSEGIGAATTLRPLNRDMLSAAHPSGRSSPREASFTAARTEEAERPTRSRARWLALGAAVLALVVGVLGADRLRQSATLKRRADEQSAQLSAHLAASRNAWLDGNFEKARQEAKEALRIDDSSGGAHLAMARTSLLWPRHADRAQFIAAQETRRGLTAEQRSYLEALAPGMALPADFALSITRLEALHRREPENREVMIALAQNLIRTQRFDEVFALLQPLADLPDADGVVFAFLGIARSMHDDVEVSRQTFQRCLANFPAASVCASFLADLESLEGNCAVAERVARQDVEMNPTYADARYQLADALDGLGADRAEVRALMAERARLKNEGVDDPNKLWEDLRFALYEGHLREALDIDAKLAGKISQIRDEYGEDSGSAYFVMSIMLRAELGLLPEAREALANYAQERHGMQHSAYFGDDLLYVAAHATTMGVIPWAEWTQMRDAHLAKGADRDTLLDGRQRIWSEYFAIPVYEAEGAKEAYRALPGYMPFIHRSERWPDHDRAIGNVFRLSGHPKEAIPYYERATASCTWLAEPIPHVHALLEFGDLLASMGDRKRACVMYEKVLERWPLHTGSRSSALADRGKMAVCGAESRR